MTAVELGDVPTWIGALASVAALGAAIYAGIIARRALRLEFDRDRDRENEGRREQASRVSAWVGTKERPPAPQGFVAGAWHADERGVLVRNGSAEPIYQVELDLWNEGALRGTHLVRGLVPPGVLFRRVPDEEYQFTHPDEDGVEVLVNDLDPTFLIQVRFTDARGRRWRRAIDGQLHLELDLV